jgi:hypothetical protein
MLFGGDSFEGDEFLDGDGIWEVLLLEVMASREVWLALVNRTE